MLSYIALKPFMYIHLSLPLETKGKKKNLVDFHEQTLAFTYLKNKSCPPLTFSSSQDNSQLFHINLVLGSFWLSCMPYEYVQSVHNGVQYSSQTIPVQIKKGFYVLALAILHIAIIRLCWPHHNIEHITLWPLLTQPKLHLCKSESFF